MSGLRHPVLHWLLAPVVGGVFVYASLDKIDKPADFARIIYHYQIIGPDQRFGPQPANTVAATLPWIEALAGVLLISGVWRREAAVVVAVLLVVFLLAVGSALYRGIDIENCGCFRVTGEGRAAGLTLVLEDMGLLAAALCLALVPPRSRQATTTAQPQAAA